MKQLTENKSKTNITNELTHGEAERRQADDKCTKIVINIRLLWFVEKIKV